MENINQIERAPDPSPDPGARECPVCLQSALHPVSLPCHHVFCYLCVKGVANQSKRCPMCRREIPPNFLDHPELVESLVDPEDGFQWFYEGRNGWWQYDERTSNEIERSHKEGEHKCELLIAGFLYTIDFENMFQYRRNDPNRRRKIKRDIANIPKKGIAGLRVESPPPLPPRSPGSRPPADAGMSRAGGTSRSPADVGTSRPSDASTSRGNNANSSSTTTDVRTSRPTDGSTSSASANIAADGGASRTIDGNTPSNPSDASTSSASTASTSSVSYASTSSTSTASTSRASRTTRANAPTSNANPTNTSASIAQEEAGNALASVSSAPPRLADVTHHLGGLTLDDPESHGGSGARPTDHANRRLLARPRRGRQSEDV